VEELRAWLTLVRAPGLHIDALKGLLEQFGSAGSLVSAPRSALIRSAAGATLADWLSLADRSAIDDDVEWLQAADHAFVHFQHAAYPSLLKEITDPPIGLYCRGDARLLASPQLAMVGSRNPTTTGRETARAFARHLAASGLTITSGLAYGIDAASHQGALEADGHTIAVCGAGLDVVYPQAHADLARQIAASGLLVSEFPPGTPPLRHHFPQRNRIISGLALGTLVVEAAAHSGSLITARLAGEQGREVFAIPGSIHNPLARGCHQLIRQGAKLVETADDVLGELGPLAGALARASSVERADQPRISAHELDKDYEILLDALGFEAVGVDFLVDRTGLGADAVASMLLILELEGRILAQPGGLYVRALPRE